jgi:hypothetical protein
VTWSDWMVRGERRYPAVLALILAATGAAAADAVAQHPGVQVDGRVLLDDRPVPNVPVTLHRVTSDTSGVLASARTDEIGGFSFRVPPADSTGFTVYFATADYLSVRYFGPPIHPGDSPSDYLVEVRDTTSDPGGALRIARRDMVLVPHAGGGWEASEVVRLENAGPFAIVSAGGMPTWEMDLPPGVEAFEAGAGDLSPGQVRRMGDRLLLMTPVIPGEREIFLRYRIPGGRSAELTAGDAIDSINVFVQQPSPRVTIAPLRPVEILTVEGQRFLQLSAASLPPDAELRMSWESSAPPVDPVWAGVGAALVVVLIGAAAAVRNRA